jgi:hypothetical protein
MQAPTGHRFCVVQVQRPVFPKDPNEWGEEYCFFSHSSFANMSRLPAMPKVFNVRQAGRG